MEQVAQTVTTSPLTPWVLGSLITYVLGTNLWWLLRGRPIPPSVQKGGVGHVLRFLFYIGIPYLVLGGWPRPPFSALLSLTDMGFVGFEPLWPATQWLATTGTGLGLGLGAFVLLVLAWISADRTSGGQGLSFPSTPWWVLVLDGLYMEVHWAFYRGSLAAIAGDLSAAAFLGLALVYLEWMLNPFWRKGWGQRGLAAGQWLRASLALVIAVIFLLTRNLWVCIVIHWLIEQALWHWGRQRAASQEAAT